MFLVLAAAAASAVHAKVGMAAMSLDVRAGRWKAVRLKNVPKDTLVDVTIETARPVSVLLLDQAGYSGFPAAPRPLFHGQVADRMSFSVTIPADGHYYLVIDNRSGSRRARVALRIRVAKESPPASTRDGKRSPQPEKAPPKSI